MDSGTLLDPFRARLVEAVAVADLTVAELWCRYLALTGSADAFEVEGYLLGLTTLPSFEHNILAEAVNERLVQLGCRGAAPYKRDD